MTDRHFSHPLTVALATLIGTAGEEFQYFPPSPLHTYTTRHKDEEGRGDVKKRIMVPRVIPRVKIYTIIDF